MSDFEEEKEEKEKKKEKKYDYDTLKTHFLIPTRFIK